MIRSLLPAILLGSFLLSPVHAIDTSGTFVTTEPTVTNWTTGWGADGITGSDYVGTIGSPDINGNYGGSGVYLGNGWVLTAGHVGPGTFLLDGTSYTPVSGSVHGIVTPTGTVDLTLFQVSAPPDLPSLKLTFDAPAAFFSTNDASQVVMLGYGGSKSNLSWGADTVDFINHSTSVMAGATYNSNDFLTILGTSFNGSTLSTNNSQLTNGDSGGGDFIYDPTYNSWVLAGINEVTISGTLGGQPFQGSGFIQLNTYATQIQDITGIEVVPEPSMWALLVVGLAFLWARSRQRR